MIFIKKIKNYNNNINMKQTIKLKETELRRMIAESVKRALNEYDNYDYTGFNEKDCNPQVEELIQNTIDKLPGKALHADAYVAPIIRDAIKKAYELGCTECNNQ